MYTFLGRRFPASQEDKYRDKINKKYLTDSEFSYWFTFT